MSSISIFLGAKFKTLLIHKLYWRSQHSMGQGPGGKNLQNLSHLHSSINYRCFHASSSRTLTMTLLLATRVPYFNPFRGVMKIRIAVTFVVLGLLSIWGCTYFIDMCQNAVVSEKKVLFEFHMNKSNEVNYSRAVNIIDSFLQYHVVITRCVISNFSPLI